MFNAPQDFALGDFDNTTIAQMEDENESEAGPGKEAEKAAGMDNAEDEGKGKGGLEELVRVPMAAAGAKPRQKPKKPLIEEL